MGIPPTGNLAVYILLAALAAAAAPAAAPDDTDRVAAVCRDYVGYDVMLADSRRVPPVRPDDMDAAMQVRMQTALERHAIPAHQREAVRMMCRFYLIGSEQAIAGILRSERERAATVVSRETRP